MNHNSSDRPLQLSSEEMRALGYQVVDMIVGHFEHVGEISLASKADRHTLEQRLREPLSEEGSTVESVLEQLQQDVFSNIMPLAHPRFFAFIPGPNNFVSVMADALTSGFNAFAGTWRLAPGTAQVELVTIDWLRQLCGLPEAAGGLFVSGGSVATLTALATARYIKLADDTHNAVVYCSDQTHWASDRALKLLGFSSHQLRRLPSDGDFRLSIAALERAIADDRAAGRRPFCIIANAGTTNTGAIDPLPALATICREQDLWLHIDAAHGGAAILTERGRSLLQGFEQADSLVLDPHKWLFQPYEIGCVLTRERGWLYETFNASSGLLKDVVGREDEVNFRDYGIQLSRNTRALKLWMSLKVFGLDAFRQAVERGFALAEYVEELVRQRPCWELLTPAQLGIITFRYRHASCSDSDLNALNQRILDAMFQDGFAFLTSTLVRGQTALRLCTINPNTTEEDIRETLRRLENFGKAL
jgi:aromatic-L-amino-acid decarboxylase